MSCGQKAWADQVEQETWDIKLANYQKHTPYNALRVIDSVIDSLELFISSDPSLTKTQWSSLERSLKRLKSLTYIPE